MKAIAKLLRRLLGQPQLPHPMSVQWLEFHDRGERDLYEGPCPDWTTAPATIKAFSAAARRLRQHEEPPS